MKAPAFWSDPASRFGAILSPLGALYGAATLARMARRGASIGIPVICVGNPTLGGAGKTPVSRALADMLAEAGHRPAVLLRGHGGSARGPRVVDPRRHGAGDVGDEALIHALRRLTIVARDRRAGAELALAEDADTIVMDDGFQNPTLAKDLSLLVVDAAVGLGNGRVFPAGPSRAPFRAQMRRADALVVAGRGEAAEDLAKVAADLGKVVLRGAMTLGEETRAFVAGRDLLAFCGIGRPDKFLETLGEAGARNAILEPFPDHHTYTAEDADRLLAKAARAGLDLVTTEKDAVKLVGHAGLDRLARKTHVARGNFRFREEGALTLLLARGIHGQPI